MNRWIETMSSDTEQVCGDSSAMFWLFARYMGLKPRIAYPQI